MPKNKSKKSKLKTGKRAVAKKTKADKFIAELAAEIAAI